MSAKLMPGDRCYFVQNDRKLRGVVAQTLNLKARGDELLVPVVRPRQTSKAETCRADGHPHKELKTRWLERSKVRKLP